MPTFVRVAGLTLESLIVAFGVLILSVVVAVPLVMLLLHVNQSCRCSCPDFLLHVVGDRSCNGLLLHHWFNLLDILVVSWLGFGSLRCRGGVADWRSGARGWWRGARGRRREGSGLVLLGATGVTLSQAFHLEVFSHGQEGVELLLSHIDLAVVHEVENCGEVVECHTLEVEERVGVGIVPEDCSEEWRAGREDDLVGLDLAITDRQGAVEEVFLLPDFAESDADVALKVIPPKAELL